jgi:hypothetical protein
MDIKIFLNIVNKKKIYINNNYLHLINNILIWLFFQIHDHITKNMLRLLVIKSIHTGIIVKYPAFLFFNFEFFINYYTY